MNIHRSRFIPYPPAAINALAFTHSSGSSGDNQPLRLAIGRANGDIEIWNPLKGAWYHETTFRGGKGRSIEGLAWIQEPDETNPTGYVTYGKLRLFSIGDSSTVTEWNLLTGLPLRQSTGNHSEVWCLAVQPRLPKKRTTGNGEIREDEDGHKGQSLVAGCADGTLVLLSTEDDDLNFARFIVRAPKKNARALSLAFQNRHLVVAGFTDSTMRIYDIRNGNNIRNMSLGSGPRGGPRDVLCWSVHCLSDGTVVSGDSTGTISFWDAKTYGQLQRINGHSADALCLAASTDGEIVMSGGMDRRTVLYTLEKGEDRKRRWVKIVHRRFHQHDVKAMASFENSKMSIVASGGLDTCPILVPLRHFSTEFHRKLSHVPQISPIASASRKRLVVSWWGNEVTIWRISRRKCFEENGQDLIPSSYEEKKHNTVARLSLRGDHTISSASISNDGTALAVATSAEVRVFQLENNSLSANKGLKIRKLKVPRSFITSGARIVKISDDLRWILRVTIDNSVQVVRIISQEGRISVLPNVLNLERKKPQKKYQNSLNGLWGSYDRTITRIAFGSHGRLLAASDIGGDIDTWILEGHEEPAAPEQNLMPLIASPSSSSDEASDDSDNENDQISVTKIYGQHWARTPLCHLLPRMPSASLILSFRPARSANPRINGDLNSVIPKLATEITDDRLFILTASHELFEFEVLKGHLSDWSRRNPSSRLPEEFRLQRDRAIGCVWDVSEERQRIWLHGVAWVCMFDLTRDFDAPVESSAENGATPVSLKRKQNSIVMGDKLDSKKHTSGAGSKIPEHELRGTVKKVRTLDQSGEEVSLQQTEVKRPRRYSSVSEQDDEDEDYSTDEGRTEDNALAQFRRIDAASAEANLNGNNTTNMPDHVVPESLSKSEELIVYGSQHKPGPSRSFYLTNRYRPILGMVPILENFEDVRNEELSIDLEPGLDDTLEVVLVERPDWELDLPPRYSGKQEWEK